MAEDKKNINDNKTETKKNLTVQEVIKENKKGNPVETATPEKPYEERATEEKEVQMIKIGRDASGRWEWARSDRITPEQKKRQQEMLEKIKRGERV